MKPSESLPETFLAETLRPQTMDQILGHQRQLDWLQKTAQKQRLNSLVLHGPPGVGKTTIARCLFQESQINWSEHSAVSTTMKTLKPILEEAQQKFLQSGERLGLFIDEIHRFNTAQQDALLPGLELGSVCLIGATTENPAHSLNRALRSRLRIVTLESLTDAEIRQAILRAWESSVRKERWPDATLTDSGLEWLIRFTSGDCRQALSILELGLNHSEELSTAIFESLPIQRFGNYEPNRDTHYDMTSALIKSMRNGDEHEAAYWLMAMADSGADPAYIARRLAIFASEDVGNEEPNALSIIDSGIRLFERVGMPEGIYSLMQMVIYLARAPKSREVVIAIRETRKKLASESNRQVPKALRNRTHSR